MRVLGLDPGTHNAGYGVVEKIDGRVVRKSAGALRLGQGTLPERLKNLFERLLEIVETNAPSVCAVEGVFSHRNTRSALILGHARGVCLLVAARYDLEVVEYAPASIKRSITGHGTASKDQVASMVCKLLQSPPEESNDASDALAIALCHLEASRPLRVFE